jgi:hypothetical protein
MAQEACPICKQGRAGHSEATCAKYIAEERKRNDLASAAATAAIRKSTPRMMLVAVVAVAGALGLSVLAIDFAVNRSNAAPVPSASASAVRQPAQPARTVYVPVPVPVAPPGYRPHR